MNDGGTAQAADTAVHVVFFDDMKGSAALKESMAARWDEQAFQALRREHDAIVTEIVSRDGAGEVIKSTGDGLLVVFSRPSAAVECAIAIQERFHGHPHISVRIGLDMGEVRVERAGGAIRDVFGRHVDWAARAMQFADGGHICVTRSVFTDAFSWITKTRIAWHEHGPHRGKPGEPPLEIFEPYNANIWQPMERLRGEKVDAAGPLVSALPVSSPPPAAALLPAAAPASRRPAAEEKPGADREAPPWRLARSWESVARDGRDFAESGAGMMYWFKVPLGGVSYPEGFRNFLQPALANPRISKIRFVLDASVPVVRQIWHELVIPQLQKWAAQEGRDFRLDHDEQGGRFVESAGPTKSLAWIFTDLSSEFTPCFKLMIHDPDSNEETEPQAQIYLSTAARTVRFGDGTMQTVRIPDAVLRIRALEHDSLIYALNSVANQWDSLFT